MSLGDHAYAAHDLGPCNRIWAESVGSPGSRFFRLRADAQRGHVLLWLEKEQLYSLAVAIKQLLHTRVSETQPYVPSASVDATADFDFKVGRMAIGHDRVSDRYLLLVDEMQEESSSPEGDPTDSDESGSHGADRGTPDLALHIDLEQLEGLADGALAVYFSGRRRDPASGQVIEESAQRVWPHTNGHHPVTPE